MDQDVQPNPGSNDLEQLAQQPNRDSARSPGASDPDEPCGEQQLEQRLDQRIRSRRSRFKCSNLAWILCMKMLSSLAIFLTAGPRVEIYTELVCKGYYPDFGGVSAVLTRSFDPTIIGSPVDIVFADRHSGRSHVEVYPLPNDDKATLPIVHGGGSPFHNVFTYSSKPSGKCAGDPSVQAEVARITATIGIIAGTLSCLTTGWWGGFLDRHGRTRTMGVIVLGPFMTDLLTLFVFRFSDELPGKYWFLVLTPVLEGMMGVPSSTMAAETSYVRDISGPNVLARNFSLLVGIFYAAGTLGPTLAGFLNERTDNVVSALYAAIMLNFAYIILAWVALPESMTQDAMVDARRRYADELASTVEAVANPLRRQVLLLSRSFWSSFPLNVLAPKPFPQSPRKRDWNLTCIAVSAGLINVTLGSVSSVYQYALYTFRWSSLDLGYFISASGLSTVLFLIVIFPAILSVSKRVRTARQNTVFDLCLVRASSLVFAFAYALMGVAPTGIIFTLCSIISMFGQGFIPAIQSVATVLHTGSSGENDMGRLFGALSVVYVLGGRIVGPAVSGAVYAVTVASLPSAILWLFAGCSLTAFLVLACVRVPKQPDRNLGAGSGSAELGRDPELDPLL